ncbi:MAG: hypothetical protein WED08_01545, partial [Patescibacteria group bacterium]
ENPTDPRLLVPHISPEALHWSRASTNLSALGETLSEVERVADGLSFWKGKAHLCGFTPESDQLISFNFEDNVFSLASNPSEAFSEGGQYTYHVREALWNRFFEEWFDNKDVLETLMIEDFGQGFVGFKIRSTPEPEPSS